MGSADTDRLWRRLLTVGSACEVRCARHALAPSVAIRVWLRGGQLRERVPGQALVVGRLLVEGSRSRSWEEIVGAAEALGMDITAFGGGEAIGLAIDALAGDWRQALEWAAELTLESSFPDQRIEFVSRQTAAELDRLGEQGEVVAGWAFLEQLYGAHPWGRPLQGSKASLAGLERADMVEFHQQSLARGVIVSLVGDIDAAEANKSAEEMFAALEAPARPDRVLAAPASDLGTIRQVEVPNGEQAHLFMGQLTVPVSHPDRVALEVAAVCLGSGPGLAGRIPTRVRESEGLAYVTHVATAAGAGSEAGRLVAYLGTAEETVDQARQAVVEEIERVCRDGITDEELENACRFLLGSQPFRRETARQIALLQAQACLYGIPVDRTDWLENQIRGLDRDAVNEAIERHLDPSSLLTTVGLPRGA